MGGAQPGSSDRLVVDGLLTLGGTLQLNLINGSEAQIAKSDTVYIIGAGGLAGAFNNVDGGKIFTSDGTASFDIVVDSVGVGLTNFTILDDQMPQLQWAGYPFRGDGWVETNRFLGWIYPRDDFVWLNSLGKYIFLPEQNVIGGGAWCYVPKR